MAILVSARNSESVEVINEAELTAILVCHQSDGYLKEWARKQLEKIAVIKSEKRYPQQIVNDDCRPVLTAGATY